MAVDGPFRRLATTLAGADVRGAVGGRGASLFQRGDVGSAPDPIAGDALRGVPRRRRPRDPRRRKGKTIRRLERHPGVVADDRRRRAARGEPVDLDLRAADHEVRVRPRDVDPRREQLVGAGAVDLSTPSAARCRTRCGSSRSRRTACRGRRGPSGGCVTTRRRGRSRRGTAPGRRSRAAAWITSAPSPSALTSTIRPSSKRTSRPSTRANTPGTINGYVERTEPVVRRQSGVVKTSSVGMFGRCRSRSSSRTSRTSSGTAARRPDHEVGARPAEPDGVEAGLVERGGARPGRLAACSRQASTGSSASSRIAAATACHSRSTSGSPNTVSRPALVRRGHDHPVRHALRDEREVDLAQVPARSPCRRARVEPVEEARIRVPGELDDRRLRLRGPRPVEEVVRRDPEFLGAELDRGGGCAGLPPGARAARRRDTARATARATWMCSTWWIRTTSWPSWTFAPTRTDEVPVLVESLLGRHAREPRWLIGRWSRWMARGTCREAGRGERRYAGISARPRTAASRRVTPASRPDPCSDLAPVEVARATPEALVERGALGRRILLAGPRGLRLGRRRLAPIERLLEARLLLRLEERVVLEGVLDRVPVERHRRVEAGVPLLEVEVLLDRLRERRDAVDALAVRCVLGERVLGNAGVCCHFLVAVGCLGVFGHAPV